MMVYFPREMWAGSLRSNAREAGRIVVKNEEEYKNFINMYNGKMNLFTSVYDYKHFTTNRGLEYSIIIDRIFLDFDAHGDEESMPNLYQDVLKMHQWLMEKDYKHNISFSGRGFHIFVYGNVAKSFRQVKAFFNICHDVVNKSPFLDTVVINTSRLRRIQNTFHLKANRWCIPITHEDLMAGMPTIYKLSDNGKRNIKPVYYGNKLVDFPEVRKMEMADIEIDSVESPGLLPILPCLKNAVMVENPNHRARVLLVQWYNEFLSELIVLNKGLNITPRQLSGEALEVIKLEIESEIFNIASNEDTWIDFNMNETKKHVSFIVDGRYMSPHCNTLIEEGLCIGKCWRYGHDSN
tara:strand:+ start:5911 stop:6963 length:1053 start_codon:yes stop_codon:yes gene_type:complete